MMMKNFYQTKRAKCQKRFWYEKQFMPSALFGTITVRMVYRANGNIYYYDTSFAMCEPVTELNRTCIARQLQQAKNTLRNHVHAVEEAAKVADWKRINDLYRELTVSADEHTPRMA
jgi:hypothetical protein